jgi:predicted transcriptional regulator
MWLTAVGLTQMIPAVVRMTLRLSEDQAAALERAARRRGVSRAAIVREALAKLLDPELGAEQRERRGAASI